MTLPFKIFAIFLLFNVELIVSSKNTGYLYIFIYCNIFYFFILNDVEDDLLL